MTLTAQGEVLRDIGMIVFAAMVIGAFTGYRALVRRFRRRRIIAAELRLEAAWQNVRTIWGITGSRKSVGLASPLLSGLQTGPQGRVLSLRPLSDLQVSPEKKPETTRSPIEKAAVAGGQPVPGGGPARDSVQQTQISCDI